MLNIATKQCNNVFIIRSNDKPFKAIKRILIYRRVAHQIARKYPIFKI